MTGAGGHRGAHRALTSGRRLAVLLAVGALLAGCGSRGSVSAGPSTIPATTASTTPPTTTTAPPTTTPGGPAYFLTSQTGDPGGPFLTAVWRPSATSPSAAVDALLAGPDRTGPYASPAITSAVPAGTRLLAVTTSGSTATVDLSGAFASGGGSTSMFSRLAQLVYTLTAQPGIDKVSLRLDGSPVQVFSNEGLVLDDPMTRSYVHDTGVVPPVLIDEPAVGQPIAAGSLQLRGAVHGVTAGRVDWSLTRGGGDRIVSGSVSVSSNAGDFRSSVTVPAGTTGRVDLVVATPGFLRQIPFELR